VTTPSPENRCDTNVNWSALPATPAAADVMDHCGHAAGDEQGSDTEDPAVSGEPISAVVQEVEPGLD
jgi:hypothetical protein